MAFDSSLSMEGAKASSPSRKKVYSPLASCTPVRLVKWVPILLGCSTNRILSSLPAASAATAAVLSVLASLMTRASKSL